MPLNPGKLRDDSEHAHICMHMHLYTAAYTQTQISHRYINAPAHSYRQFHMCTYMQTPLPLLFPSLFSPIMNLYPLYTFVVPSFCLFFQILFDAVLKILNKCTDHIFKPSSLSIIMNNELFSYHSVHVWSSAGLRDTNDGRQTFTICPGFVRFI